MIIIASSAQDVHARRVLQELEKVGHDARVVDFRKASTTNHASLRISDSGESMRTGDVAWENVTAVWIRRPRVPQVPAAVAAAELRTLVTLEWERLMDGMLLNVGASARCVNDLTAQRRAVKARQLQAATQAGLRIPRTLITNDPAEATEFIRDEGGEVVHKSMTQLPGLFMETKRWDASSSQMLDVLPLAPTIFQQNVRGPGDVRVTVVGEICFSALILSQTRDQVDSRIGAGPTAQPYELPTVVRGRLLSAMRDLGLEFATVDFKLTDEGDLVFLEINPQGQFLYIEILTGLAISQAMAGLLAS